MRDEEIFEQLREGLRRFQRNPQELWDRLVQEGIIDQEGNVLVRMPEPPSSAKPKKKKTKESSQRSRPSESGG